MMTTTTIMMMMIMMLMMIIIIIIAIYLSNFLEWKIQMCYKIWNIYKFRNFA